MSEILLYKAFGFFNPYGNLPGFCTLIFNSKESAIDPAEDVESPFYVQDVTRGNICQFSTIHLEPKNVRRFMKKDIFEVGSNTKEIFCFYFNTEHIIGTRAELIQPLSEIIPEIKNDPHLLRDVASFVGDLATQERANKEIDELYNKELEDFRVISSKRPRRPLISVSRLIETIHVPAVNTRIERHEFAIPE